MTIDPNPPAAHEPGEDFENIPPVPPTPESDGDMARVSGLRNLLDEYGFNYTEEPGWEQRQRDYHWYSGGPFGVMVHHTATSSYAAKRAYPQPEGDRTDGKTICNALVQIDGEINLIAAGPANYSSGLNWKGILDDYVAKGIRFHGPQSGSLGAEWYGNRAWINIEVVHLGDGGQMPQAQEEALIGLISMLCYLFDWDSTAVIGHLDGRGTKIDPRWDGPWSEPPYTIAGIQDRVQDILDTGQAPPSGGDMFTLFKIGEERAEWEPIVWFLFGITGGTINANDNSAQVQTQLPWKTNVRLVQTEDFEMVADILELNDQRRSELITGGLYRFGKEIAALEQIAYR